MADPIDWGPIEKALTDWFNNVTGIVTIWGQQDGQQPAYPYGVLTFISGPVHLGGQDEQRWTTDLGKPLGEEVGVEVAGLRTFTISSQIRVGRPDISNPIAHARHLSSVAQHSLGLPSVLEAFQNVGISVINEGNVLNISEVVEDTWINVSTFDVIFGVASTQEERTGYIKTAQVKSSELGIDEIVGDL